MRDICIGRLGRITRKARAIARPRRRNFRIFKAGAITAKSASRASNTIRQRLIVSQLVSPGGKNFGFQQ